MQRGTGWTWVFPHGACRLKKEEDNKTDEGKKEEIFTAKEENTFTFFAS